MRSLIKPSFCFVLAVLLLVDANLVHRWVALAEAQEADKQAKKELTAEDLKKMADEMEKAFKALEAAEKEIPRDTFDPKVIVDKVGRDPVKLFEWVRDNTYWVPYQGCLRGPIGVLMDRLGSSLDRALLMLELLDKAGHKRLQLAFALLSEGQAAHLVEDVHIFPANKVVAQRLPPLDEINPIIEQQAKKYEVDPTKVRTLMEQVEFRRSKLHEEAIDRTTEQTSEILGLLRYKIKIPNRQEQAARLLADAIKGARHHWWVQWHDGTKWVDLDCSLPSAKPGDQIDKPTRIVPRDKMDEDLKDQTHQVVIRLVIERWNHGKAEQAVVFAQPLLPCAFIGQRITIHHAPMNWPNEANLFATKDGLDRFKSLVSNETEWMPVLTVESQRAAQNAFTTEGEITRPKKLPPAVKTALAGAKLSGEVGSGAKELGGGVSKILGGGGIKGMGKRSQEQSEPTIRSETHQGTALTAEWIEYEIRAPGRDTQRIRREIFDILGPAAREAGHKQKAEAAPKLDPSQSLQRGLALLGETEILLQVCDFSSEFIAHLALKASLVNRKILPEIMRHAGDKNPKTLISLASQLTGMSRQLYGFAAGRHQWRRSSETYLDLVNITSFHQFMEFEGRKLKGKQALDIVLNEIAVQWRANRNPFEIRLEQGVLDTNAEVLVNGPANSSDNTSDQFRARRKENISWNACTEEIEFAAGKANAPPDVVARMRQDLGEGRLIIAPQKATAIDSKSGWSWWRIDPRTGTASGIGHRGWGQDTSEYVLMIAGVAFAIVSAISCLREWEENKSTTSKVLCAGALLCLGLPVAFLLFCMFNPLTFIVAPLVAIALVGAAPVAVTGWAAVCEGLAAGSEVSGWTGAP